jgi:hypothetical protein
VQRLLSSPVVVRALGAFVVGTALCTGCSEPSDRPQAQSERDQTNIADEQPSADSAPTLTNVSATSFRASLVGSSTCAHDPLSGPSEVWPSESSLEATIGAKTAEFGAIMAEEIDLQRFPFPSGRDIDIERDSTYRARANAIANSQHCALRFLEAAGGRYLESFVLINAFVAELTVEQAILLSKRADVRLVELGQTNEPPP